MKKKFLALLLSVCMLASLVVIPAAAVEINDMADDHWAKESADRWTQAGVMVVDEEGNFNPTDELTRAEFAIMLCKLMGYTEKSDPSTFNDLPEDAEAADALLKLNAAGVMLGVGHDRADPDGKLTREHVGVMVFRALKLQPVEDTSMSFTDADKVSSWAKAEMATMASLKMIEGVGNNTLAPRKNIPNQDMAALLDKMVAAYVTENGATVDLAEAANPNGVVIIKANNVKIANAADSTSIVITEDAPKNTTVTVTGSASDITVAAEGAKVVVAKGAEVGSVTLEAPKTSVEISGTVESVAVAEGADNATVTAKSGAKVDEVTTSAEKVKVNGAKNTIGTVVADAGSAEVKASGAEVKNEGADSVKVDNKVLADGDTTTSKQNGTSTSTGGSSSVPSTPVTPDPPAETYTLKLVMGKQEGVPANAIESVKIGEEEIDGSTEVEGGKVVKIIVKSSYQIAVGLVGENVIGDMCQAKYTTRDTGDFVCEITITMPNNDAALCIAALTACEAKDNDTVGVKLSACKAEDATDEGIANWVDMTGGTPGSDEEVETASE